MKLSFSILLACLGAGGAFAQTDTNLAPIVPTPPPLQLGVEKPASGKPPAPLDPGNTVLGRMLLEASEHGDAKRAASLLDQGAPVNYSGKGGMTPLMQAAIHSPEIVKLLLGHGASLELQDSVGYTALGAACRVGQTDCARQLIDAGANIEVLNKNGHTPLVLAVEGGDDDLVQLLIQHHAQVNRDMNNGSAIWWAISKDRPRAVAMLLAAGADFQPHLAQPPDAQNPPYSVLAIAAMTNDSSLVDLLLAHGAKLDEPDLAGRTPLAAAITFGNEAMVHYFLQKNADATKPDNQGTTPLMLAVEYQQTPVWEEMLQHGATIEAKDHDGRTALSLACREVYLPAVQWLVGHGADVNVTDRHGITPLLEAGDRGDSEVMQYLKDHGAHPLPLHILAKNEPTPPLPNAQRWALAVSAPYFQWNGLNPHVLGGEENADSAKNILSRDWNIKDQKTLERTVEWLRLDGSRVRYQREGAKFAAWPNWLLGLLTYHIGTNDNTNRAIRENYLSWHNRSGLAWDLCRASFIVNEGYACNYIDEPEAWRLLFPIARETQANFASWHEMCDNFLDAREMWKGNADPDLETCADLLCNYQDPNSPWNQIPWNTDLTTP